jgi:hypothetical protein
MTGNEGVRLDATGTKRGPLISPPILSPALANVDARGIVTKSGYAFRISLPAEDFGAARECRGSALSAPVDVDAAEARWCAYAWPVAVGNSGKRAFFVDQDGEVWQTDNAVVTYTGMVNGTPAWDAALPAGTGTGWVSAPKGASHTGRDGNVWKRTN